MRMTGATEIGTSVDDKEAARLAALHSYNILDTAPEEAFDRITRLVRTILGTPIALVSLIDDDRQWFKSRQGLEVTQTAREFAFCAHTIDQDDAYVVTDASEHPLFRGNPLVTGEPNIRYYIGVPLTVPGGHNIGTLCAIDRKPRELSGDQIQALRDLARLAVDQIELRQIATSDPLTGALTRRGFELEMDREVKRKMRSGRDLSVVMVDIDHFKTVNDRFGHAAGDFVLRNVVGCIKRELRANDFVGRLGGEEFAVALPETNAAGARLFAERLRARISDIVVVGQSGGASVTASMGISSCEHHDPDWAATLKRADDALYEAKTSGRNRCVVSECRSMAGRAA
jgi:diguanylate cyclase (GGDEF)-like protein